MVTIRDVAKAAGVSPSTISGVLNDTISVQPSTRERIEEAIERLNYRPNAMARALRTRQAPALGLIIPSIENPYYPAVARGAEDVAHAHGYSLFVCNTDRDEQKELGYLKALTTQASGVILADRTVVDGAVGEILDSGLKVIQVNPAEDFPGVKSLSIDYISGCAEAVEHLIKQGHRLIGFVSGPLDRWRFRERFRGYKQGLAKGGIVHDDSHVVIGDLTVDGGYSACQELLRLQSPPTAIMFANDVMALGGLSAVSDVGLRVPSDISIVGIDDIPLAGQVRPRLTTVYQPSYELGRVAVFNLLKDDGDLRDSLGTHLVVRESSGPVPSVVVKRPVV